MQRSLELVMSMTGRNPEELTLALRLGTHAYKNEVINYFLGQLHGYYGLFTLYWTKIASDRSKFHQNYKELNNI